MQLLLSNWKCHEDTRLEFCNGVDLVLGANGTGKSALVDAVEFVLLGTGKLAGIHTKPDLGAFAVRDESGGTVVHLDLPDAVVSRSMKRDGTQELSITHNGKPTIEGGLRAMQPRLNELVGLDEGQVRAVLDARKILEGPEKERRAILFGATGFRATEAEVLECFRKLGLEGADVLQAAQDYAMDGSWRDAEKLAGERRAAVTRDLKDLKKIEPVHIFNCPGAEEPTDLRKWPLAELYKRQKRQEETVDDATRGEGADVGRAEETLRQKKADHERTVSEANELTARAELPEHKAVGLLELANSNAKSEVAEADEALEACQDARDDLGPVALLPQVIEKPEPCPVIIGKPACPMTKPKLAAHLVTVAAQGEQRAQQIEAAEEHLELAQTRNNHAHEKLIETGEAFKAERSRLVQLSSTHDRIDTIEDEIGKAETDLEKANEMAKAAEGSQLHRERLARTHLVIAARQIYDGAVKAAENYDERQADLQDKHERADRIAQALKPTGIESTLLEKLVGPLAEKLAEIGKHLGEMRINEVLEIELKWRGRWRRFQQLSESTRERVAIAVQHAIASIAGFPVLIVDRIDHLDPIGKRDAMRALVEVSPQYRAVLALATIQSAEPTKAKAAGVTTWYLAGEGGPLVRVE